MCDYCEKGKILIEKEILEGSYMGWLEELQAFNEFYKVEIRQGTNCLCLGKEDEQCIDAFEYIKINFCPMCGIKLL